MPRFLAMAKTKKETEHASPQLSDAIGTSLLAVIGIVAVVMGLGYGFRQPTGEVGPGFLPVVTGGFVAVASLAEIARLYLSTARRDERAAAESVTVNSSAGGASGAGQPSEVGQEEVDTFGRVKSEREGAILKIFGLLFLALLLVDFIGLLLALAGMVFCVVFWVEKKGLVPALTSSVCAIAVAYLLFVQLLGVPAPQGMLGLI